MQSTFVFINFRRENTEIRNDIFLFIKFGISIMERLPENGNLGIEIDLIEEIE